LAPSKAVTAGFIIAGLFNVVGIGGATMGFTSDRLAAVDPGAFSTTGSIVIAIWGLAYMSLATSYHRAPLVSLAFAVEKSFYAIRWGWWLSENRGDVPDADALFFYTYGLGDAFWAGFFAWVWWRYRVTSPAPPRT